MADTIKYGGCLCGSIRFSIERDPDLVYYCHCADCRKAGGSAMHVGLLLPRSAFRLHAGSPKAFAKIADSGREIVRYFCGDCGSPIYSSTSVGSDYMSLKAGTLDDPRGLRPTVEIWTESRVDWATPPGDLDSHVRGRSG